MMTMGSPPEFGRRMARTYSESTDSTAPFSECRSDRTGDLDGLLVCSDDDLSDEMVRGFILDLQSPSVESQLRAVTVLRCLAKNSTENRLRIARAGAVAPLVALLSHPDPQLQEHGVTAILNLSLCDENKGPIAAAGAVCHLVRALRVGTPVARENAASAVFRLSQLDDLPAVLGRSGSIPPLVALLETGSYRGKKDAATALYALLATEDNVAPAVEARVVHPLLDLMADPKSGMVEKAAFVLLRVLATPEGRAATVDEGGVPVLVDMLETGRGKQKKVAMLSLLQICAETQAYRRLVVREGAIPPLIALSQSSRDCEKKVGNLTSPSVAVRSAPLTCKRTPRCKDDKHDGGHDGMVEGTTTCRGCHANPQPFLEDDNRPGVPLTRIKPRATHGHGRGFPRPHQLGRSTSRDGVDHNPIPTPAGAFDGSSTSTPANGVTDGPKPGNPASRRGTTTSGRRGAITSGRRGATTSGPSFADTLSTDSLREQVR
ncbi:hypothetical protein B296_00056008 [Ensete ventricosum]|uniref:U-box domain-containing protein n=1 Tax=Ensete ventricosum TaxID=4639 RepID=A0A426X2S1_ENSVE|nr:hypothetical protein B296_00056008 [Ensete ventricosum]